MLGIWFSYGPDGPSLIESVGAFRESTGGNCIVSVVDDSKKPISKECLELISPDDYMKTDFPRGSSLNGWGCVKGMLGVFQELTDKHGADGFIKIDCDTLVLGFDWIDRKSAHCGFIKGEHLYAMGMAYWLRSDVIATITESINGRQLLVGASAPEDQCISCETLWKYGPQCSLVDWSKKLAGGWQYLNDADPRFDNCQVITFGNRSLIKGKCCGNDKREKVAIAMARYRKQRKCLNCL